MNSKPLLVSAAVLVLCGFSVFHWRDDMLGRVAEIHTGSTEKASSPSATASNANGVSLNGNLQSPARSDLSEEKPGQPLPLLSQAQPLPQPASQPPSTTQNQGAQSGQTPVVDESALRYFAARGDTARLQAEIARLKALYPNWTPPADPTAVPQSGDAQLEAMWQLYANGRYAEVRKAIADRQSAEAGWQPPSNLTDLLNLAEARQRLVNSSDLKQYSAVIDVAAQNPGLLTCSEVDVLWRVAEAFARTEKPERARDAYIYILANCNDAAQRLATVQKASTLIPVPMVEDLLAREKPGSDGQLEFEPVKDDLARQFVAKGGEDKDVIVPQPYVLRLERLAESNDLASDALLLGWYNIRRNNMQDAEKWFRKAIAAEDSASAAQGLGLALIAREEPREAENVLFKWRTSSDDAHATYLAAAANLLALDPPVPLDPPVLQRIAADAMAQKDAATAQEFGWYSRAFQQPQMAQQWFETALQWKADDEASAYGLALTYQQLNNAGQLRQIQREWGDRSQRIAEVGRATPAGAQARASVGQAQATGVSSQSVSVRDDFAPSATSRSSQPAVSQRQPTAGRQTQLQQRAGRCSISAHVESLPPQAALQQGWCLMDINRPVEALKAFGVALKGGQSDLRSDAAYGQSLAYLRMGLTDNAAASATSSAMDRQKATELQVAILTDRALAAYQAKRYEEALILLDQRARLATERVDLMVIRGYAYLNMQRYGEAIQIFEGAAATGNTDAIRGLANARDARPSLGPRGG
ncbi:cellulose synthase [Agrobacterium larrymoorei]|uniref:cellulose synthase n=1 Tax=Agrobacterium larrymoorei TaxID=160699 RepID=UPI001571D61E|nr:cellulose synthase [Agrobacterium larrymoorei]NTJ44856.1 cellulose synthase [Agrobacterium larrymoorei]